MAEVFFRKADCTLTAKDNQSKELYAKIGQLTVVRVFWPKPSVVSATPGGKLG